MKNNLISVIVPVYNVEKYLRRCVESLLRNDSSFEIILVDDGSEDESGRICDSYAEADGRISVIHKENGGLSDARNAGIEKASGEYITFIDSDDFVTCDYISRMAEIMNKTGSDIVQCEYEKGNNERFSGEKILPQIKTMSGKEALAGYRLKSQSCCKMYKKNLFDGISFPKGRLNEDEFTTYKLVYKAKKAAFTNEKLYYYYQRSESIMNSIASNSKKSASCGDWIEAYRERLGFFEKLGEQRLLSRTHEKFCVDIMLRYIEQMRLKKDVRIEKETLNAWLGLYRKHLSLTDKKYISLKRRFIYSVFRYFPYAAVVASNAAVIRD